MLWDVLNYNYWIFVVQNNNTIKNKIFRKFFRMALRLAM